MRALDFLGLKTTGAGYASGAPLPGLGIGAAADFFMGRGARGAGRGVLKALSRKLTVCTELTAGWFRGRCAGGRSGAAAKHRRDACATASASGHATGPIRCWIVGATGFRQSRHHPTGLERVWQELRSLSSPEVCVLTPQAWDNDAEALAEYIARNSAAGATVFFYGYSYGVGHFFIRLARALKRLGIRIAMAVTCDGIRRWRLLKFLSLRFFALFVVVPVPANVREVYAFRQSEDGLLRGHRLLADDPEATTVHDCPLHGYDHYDIDEAQSFRRVVLKEARDLVEEALRQAQGGEVGA